MPGRNRRPEGIVVRHARRCPAHRGEGCDCRPSYQAQVFSARDRKTVRKTFRTLADARDDPSTGETLCLDYANSISWSPENEHVDPEQTDVLRTGDTLRRRGRRLGLLSDDAKPASEAELRRARALQDAVHRLFASISHERNPPTKEPHLAGA
jgi:Putative stress-induced transcription regulator